MWVQNRLKWTHIGLKWTHIGLKWVAFRSMSVEIVSIEPKMVLSGLLFPNSRPARGCGWLLFGRLRQLMEDSWTVPGARQAALGWHELCERGARTDRCALVAGGRNETSSI